MASCNLLKFSESGGYGCKILPNMLGKILKTTSKNNASDDHKLQFLIADKPDQFYIIGKVNSGSASVPLIGIVLGLMYGAVGQGGGFIYLPVMIYIFHCNPKVAIASAPVIGLLSSVSIFSGRAFTDTIDWWLCFYLIIGIFVGAKIGAMISLKLNEVVLRKCINVFFSKLNKNYLYGFLSKQIRSIIYYSFL
ncbi:sulfite exporter TauE/SafE family protein [Moritella sp. 5]|uniref:sulfite exporter TauE/SafE family protein n=1 Tax=Moritella sp. 5 TaxID=2746231 RepID=UPI001BA9A3F6|nr:sulfite exporter TauE/SafE family protein [Moritella sp. 5]QUM80331.1 sulfite exporter TauE/SafE family protein [Moritella sp. 5]